jgi:hypothetical protein
MTPQQLDSILDALIAELRGPRAPIAKIHRVETLLNEAEARFDSRSLVQSRGPRRRP